MSFLTDEQSAAGSRPVEIFTFTTPIATYRYTTAPVAYSYLLSDFAPLAGLRRSEIAGSSAQDPPEMTIELPIDAPIVQAEAFDIPSDSIEVVITRVQPTGALTLWYGFAAAFEIEGRIARMRVPSMVDDALASTIPGVRFQYLCNHQLYSQACGVDGSSPSYSASTTIVGWDGRRTYTVNSIAGKPDDWYTAGYVTRLLDGAKRSVERQLGTSFTLSAPFRSFAVGQSVTLRAGCNHSVFDCADKFANIDNHGGFPSIPSANPLASLKGLL